MRIFYKIILQWPKFSTTDMHNVETEMHIIIAAFTLLDHCLLSSPSWGWLLMK